MNTCQSGRETTLLRQRSYADAKDENCAELLTSRRRGSLGGFSGRFGGYGYGYGHGGVGIIGIILIILIVLLLKGPL